MANYTQVPTPLASAMVTATFGVTAQARKLHNGNITPEDFIDNCEIICLDVAVSALSSMLGEVLIPIPIFGTIVGNAVGMFMFEISKTYLSATEQRLISKYQKDYNKFIELLETDYQEFVKKLNEEVSRFTTMLALVFDGTENQGFEASVVLAKSIGTSEEKIIKTRAERDAFFIVE